MKSEVIADGKSLPPDEFPKFWADKKRDRIFMETRTHAVCLCHEMSKHVGSIITNDGAHKWSPESWDRITGELIIKYTI